MRIAPRVGRVGALGAVAAAGLLVAALAPASAASHSVSVSAHTAPALNLHHLKIGPAGSTSSQNWAGYTDTSGGGAYTKVSSTWTEPAVTCSTGDQIAVFWVGIDGYTSGTVEQDGTLAECENGKVVGYATWWEMYPAYPVEEVGQTVQPGDKIKSVVSRSGSTYTLTVTDKTHPANSFTETQSCSSCQNSSAEWIAERPSGGGGLYSLPDFGTITFNKAKAAVGSTKGSISKFPYDSITMVNSSGQTLVSVGGLSKKGKTFTATWHQSA